MLGRENRQGRGEVLVTGAAVLAMERSLQQILAISYQVRSPVTPAK